MKKVEMNGMYEPIFNKKTSPALPKVVTPKKLKRTNIISGEIAFPESSGRATVEPKKAESTTYIKTPRIMKKTVLSEIASARCWVIGEFGARKSLTTGISALKIQTATSVEIMASSDTREDHFHDLGSFFTGHFLGCDTRVEHQNHIKQHS